MLTDITPTDTDTAAAQDLDKVRAPTIRDFATFLKVLEDGKANLRFTKELEALAEAMDNHAFNHSSKTKGKITLTFDFTLNGGIYEILSKIAVKHPAEPSGRSVLWLGPDNQFSPQNPRQTDMFAGPRKI